MALKTSVDVADLHPDVLKQLAILLNPKKVLVGDWRTMAGEFGAKYAEIINYDRYMDPTLEVLKDWWSKKGDKSVSELLRILKKMDRYDAVKLLKPYALRESSKVPKENDSSSYCDISNGVSSDGDIDNGVSSDGDISNGASSNGASINGASINGHCQPVEGEDHTNSYIDSGKAAPMENISTDTGELVESGVESSTENEANEAASAPDNEGSGLQNRGSERPRANLAATSVQTQIPSPTAGIEAPVFPSPGHRETNLTCPCDKIALVIGNQNYIKEQYNNLSYTQNDAYDIATALTELGFKVLSMVDLTLTEMRTSMLAFCRLLGPGIYAVIYYAGHGFELEGENYLLPVDAKSPDPNESIRAQEFLQEMQICDALLNLMFLDCCRTRLEDHHRRPTCNLKRGNKGNTIIAYSCCTQHGAFEEPNQKNGVYAKHLLKNIFRDERIENILMDVSTAVVESRSVDQRPTFESDAYIQCRLTSPIMYEEDGQLMTERWLMWKEGNQIPSPMSVKLDTFDIVFQFEPVFGNVLVVDVYATSKIQKRAKNLYFVVQVFSPLEVKIQSERMTLDPLQRDVCLGSFRIFKLQKLCNENLFLTIEFHTDDESYLKKINFGTPLISGITNQFHEWITDRKYQTPSGSQSSWI